MKRLTSYELAEQIYNVFNKNGFYDEVDSNSDETKETLVSILDGNATAADGDIPLIIQSLEYECIATAETKRLINILYSMNRKNG